MLIVGAGYAGLSAGLVLAREGRSVAAFDAMNPGRRGFYAQRRNNQRKHSAGLRDDHATVREEKAIAIEAEGKTAREFLYDFIKTEELACDFEPVGQFEGRNRI